MPESSTRRITVVVECSVSDREHAAAVAMQCSMRESEALFNWDDVLKPHPRCSSPTLLFWSLRDLGSVMLVAAVAVLHMQDPLISNGWPPAPGRVRRFFAQAFGVPAAGLPSGPACGRVCFAAFSRPLNTWTYFKNQPRRTKK